MGPYEASQDIPYIDNHEATILVELVFVAIVYLQSPYHSLFIHPILSVRKHCVVPLVALSIHPRRVLYCDSIYPNLGFRAARGHVLGAKGEFLQSPKQKVLDGLAALLIGQEN